MVPIRSMNIKYVYRPFLPYVDMLAKEARRRDQNYVISSSYWYWVDKKKKKKRLKLFSFVNEWGHTQKKRLKLFIINSFSPHLFSDSDTVLLLLPHPFLIRSHLSLLFWLWIPLYNLEIYIPNFGYASSITRVYWDRCEFLLFQFLFFSPCWHVFQKCTTYQDSLLISFNHHCVLVWFCRLYLIYLEEWVRCLTDTSANIATSLPIFPRNVPLRFPLTEVKQYRILRFLCLIPYWLICRTKEAEAFRNQIWPWNCRGIGMSLGM